MAKTPEPDAGQIPLFKPKQLPRGKHLSKQAIKAQRVMARYAIMAGGLGLIPMVRLAGQIAVGGLLLKLLNDLCRIYGVSFSDQQAKILIAGILGGAHYGWISRYLIRFAKGASPVGSFSGALLLRPAVSGALVYYIGKLFLVHLESGVWYAQGKSH